MSDSSISSSEASSSGSVPPDPFTINCVLCASRPCVRGRDYCADCLADDEAETDGFGRCYVCRDFHDHEHCIGVRPFA